MNNIGACMSKDSSKIISKDCGPSRHELMLLKGNMHIQFYLDKMLHFVVWTAVSLVGKVSSGMH